MGETVAVVPGSEFDLAQATSLSSSFPSSSQSQSQSSNSNPKSKSDSDSNSTNYFPDADANVPAVRIIDIKQVCKSNRKDILVFLM
jgi:hypothetical protein